MPAGYVELHAKSFYSFGTGASHVHELLAQAKEYGYPALALTDANLCGALEFARLAGSLGVRPITGGEFALTGGSRLVLLARNRQGYANILPAVHPGQRRRPAGPQAGPGSPARPRRGSGGAHRGAGRGDVQVADRRPE